MMRSVSIEFDGLKQTVVTSISGNYWIRSIVVFVSTFAVLTSLVEILYLIDRRVSRWVVDWHIDLGFRWIEPVRNRCVDIVRSCDWIRDHVSRGVVDGVVNHVIGSCAALTIDIVLALGVFYYIGDSVEKCQQCFKGVVIQTLRLLLYSLWSQSYRMGFNRHLLAGPRQPPQSGMQAEINRRYWVRKILLNYSLANDGISELAGDGVLLAMSGGVTMYAWYTLHTCPPFHIVPQFRRADGRGIRRGR